jgi:hypothetical protein
MIDGPFLCFPRAKLEPDLGRRQACSSSLPAYTAETEIVSLCPFGVLIAQEPTPTNDSKLV